MNNDMLDYLLARFDIDEEGQTMAEYAVVLAVITVGIITALAFLTDGIETALRTIGNTLAGN